MAAYSEIDMAAAVVAAMVMAGALFIYWLERRRALPADDDEVLQSLRPVIRRHLCIRILVLLAVVVLTAGVLAFLVALNSGLAFAGGALSITAAAVLAGAGGVGRWRHLSLAPADDIPPWTEPSPPSLALGLFLASSAFLAVWLLLYLWPEPLLLLYFISGALASAFIARIGGSFTVLSCNAGFERIHSIAAGLNRKKPLEAPENYYSARDHGGLAAEFAVVYIAVMALAMGLGILDKGSSHGLIGSIVQITATTSLLSGFVILLLMRRWSQRPERAALLNKAILTGMAAVLVSGIAAGYVLFKTMAVDMLWPMVAAFVVLFITAAVLQYNTSRRYKTVRNVARHSTYGPEVLILGGNSLGMGGMIIPLLMLALLAVLADGAGSGKSSGTACMVMAAGFIASLAPLLTPYYFADESCDISSGSRALKASPSEGSAPAAFAGPSVQEEGGAGAAGRRGSMVASLMGSIAFISTGLAVLAGLGLMLRLGREGSLYAVSLFAILAYFGGTALAIGIQACLYASLRDMLADVTEAYRRPQRELAAGRQQWSNEIYSLHCAETGRYGIVHPWLPLLLAAAAIALDVFLLGAETIIPMMLAFAASGLCFLLWLEITGSAWSSAYRFVNAGNYAEKGSESHRLARGLAATGLIYRQAIVPALRLLLLLTLFGSLLLLISGMQ